MPLKELPELEKTCENCAVIGDSVVCVQCSRYNPPVGCLPTEDFFSEAPKLRARRAEKHLEKLEHENAALEEELAKKYGPYATAMGTVTDWVRKYQMIEREGDNLLKMHGQYVERMELRLAAIRQKRGNGDPRPPDFEDVEALNFEIERLEGRIELWESAHDRGDIVCPDDLRERLRRVESENALMVHHLRALAGDDNLPAASAAVIAMARIQKAEREIASHAEWAKQFTVDPANSTVVEIMRENVALKAEVERLRGEIDVLKEVK